MSKNFTQPGNTLTLAAPDVTGCKSGVFSRRGRARSRTLDTTWV
jgi:predicted RecA/RadA family phage recombinase